jgi:hypothetical protein
MRPNGLAFSGGLEGSTLIDRNGLLAPLDANIAPIQPLRWNAWLGAVAWLAPALSHLFVAPVRRSDIAELIVHFVCCYLIEDQQKPPHNFIGWMPHRDNDAGVGLADGEVCLS